LVSDVTGITATNVFTENIIFEGATADDYETTLAVTDPTADRTVTIPNATGTVVLETSSGVVINEDSADVDFRIETDSRTHMFFVDGGNDNITIDAGNVLSGAAGDGTLHITKGTAGSVTANTTFDELVIEGNTHAGISILTPASQTGGIVFGDPDDNDVGSIQYSHATDKLTFVIAASTEMQMTTAAIFPNSVDGLSLGLSSNEWSDLYLADGGVIYFGNDQDVSLTHVADTGLLLSSTDQLQFGDSGTYIHQSADGVLDLVSDTEIEINATTIDINGNVEISGDLTVSGDDITMGTNTSGAVLVADGTNFNPVVVSGDATIATNGALTIAANAVEGSMLNNNTISGLTALTSGLATTDELMVSDAGTLKRMDVSVLSVLTDGSATALAIALG
jgi:phage baseplate assembly protein gpV